MDQPEIHIFENRLFVTDRNKESIIYHGQKFPTRDVLYDKMIISKRAINIKISNSVLSKSPLQAEKMSEDGVFRYARNLAKTTDELLKNLQGNY